MDEIKGRVKEAGGDITGDDSMKREGKVDRVTGQAKDHLDDMGDKTKDVVDGARDKVKDLLDRD